MYQTTSEFLDYFGLATLEDLPSIDMNEVSNEDTDDVELFTSTYKEIDN